MKNFLYLLACIVFTVSIGAIGGIATASGVNDWYLTIVKPGFNPPNYIFGQVWSLLYLLMGISFYLILQAPKSSLKNQAIYIFLFQLGLNFLWSFIFFKFQLVGLALVEILLIWFTILGMILIFKKVNKTAAYIQIPYLLWVGFASILNGSIWYLNL